MYFWSIIQFIVVLLARWLLFINLISLAEWFSWQSAKPSLRFACISLFWDISRNTKRTRLSAYFSNPTCARFQQCLKMQLSACISLLKPLLILTENETLLSVCRKRSPYKWKEGENVVVKNSVRVAEVWMDDYKHYYYERINNDLVSLSL